jgi:hypothetical protein
VSSDFDRLRPRTPRITAQAATTGHDSEGKRALFSATGSTDRPGLGSVLVECSRCLQRTVLGPRQALRASLPSLHLALRVGHRQEVTVLGARRDYPTYLRCPACGRASWVRFTLQV